MMQEEVIQYFEKRHNVKKESISDIDLDAMERVLNSSKNELGKKVKNINYEWHTMEISKRWKKTDSALCSLCHQEDENWKHIYKCQCSDMIRCKREQIQKIKKTLVQLQTLPQIKDHFINVLQNIEVDFSPESLSASRYTTQIQDAHITQLKIGYQAFLKGFLCKKWFQIQEQYYRQQRVGRQHNIHRWRKEVVRIIIQFGNELWNERCTIVNAENNATDEQLFRTRMYEFCLKMKQNKDQLHPRDQHLLQRNRKYFLRTDRTNIEMWQIRLRAALSCELHRRDTTKDTIEPYIIRKKVRRSKRKFPKYIPPKLQYRQQNLFQALKTTQIHPQSASQVETEINLSEITQRRKRLRKLVQKRKMKKRQSTLEFSHHPIYNSVATKKRKKIMIRDVNDRTKKRECSYSNLLKAKKLKSNENDVRRNGKSVREKIRAMTGQDPKNNR